MWQSLVLSLVEWLIEKFALPFIKKEFDQIESDKSIESQADKDKQQLVNAQTDEDKENALKSIVDHTFTK